MRWKSLLLLLVTFIIAGAAAMIYFAIEKLNHKKLAQQNVTSVTTFDLYDLDSIQFNIKANRKAVLIYFDSECDHCQYELDQVISNRTLFKDADIILASSEEISSIKRYAQKTLPVQADNIHFTKIHVDAAYHMFGSLAVPQIYIYSDDGHLLRTFKGETKIDAILQYL